MFMSNIDQSTYYKEDLLLENKLHLLDFESLRDSPSFTVLKFSDAHYLGEIKDGVRHGKGLMRYKSGRLFEGHWRNDLREGRGYERYANGHTYEGCYHKGKPHGYGVYSWGNNRE
jgi:hypothetical protein